MPTPLRLWHEPIMAWLQERIDDAILAIARIALHWRHGALRRHFFSLTGEHHDLATPCTLNDKVQWRKLFDRGPFMLLACDKLETRAFIARTCPDLPLPALLWEGADPADIPDALWERPGVLKQSNACDRTIFLGPGVDRAAATETCRQWLRHPFGRELGEWAYAQLPARLLIEEYVGPGPGEHFEELCFDMSGGRVVKVARIVEKKRPLETKWQYAADGTLLPGVRNNEGNQALLGQVPDGLPTCFSAAKAFAERLSAGSDHVRVDFHTTGGRMYASEMTVYPASGALLWNHPGFARARDEAWDLRQSWFLTTPQTGWRRIYAGALRRRLDRDAARRAGLGGPSPFAIAAFMEAWPQGWAMERPVAVAAMSDSMALTVSI